MKNTQRVVAVTAAVAAIGGGAVVAPAVASASTNLSCYAFADDPEVIGPNTIRAYGSGKATPGTSGGLTVLGQNVDNMDIEIILLQNDPIVGHVRGVAYDSNHNDGRSQLGQALNNTAPVEIGQSVSWRANGVSPAQIRYTAEVTVSCESTNGTWSHDTDVSDQLVTYLH